MVVVVQVLIKKRANVKTARVWLRTNPTVPRQIEIDGQPNDDGPRRP